MTFNFKERAQALLAKMAPELAVLAGEGLYGLVCASILYPVAQAVQQSDAAGQAEIAATLAAMGISVLSSRIQRWQDVNEAAKDIAALPPGAPEHEELATALVATDAQATIERNLAPDQAAEFAAAFRKALKKAGHSKRYSAKAKPHGVVVQGRGHKTAANGGVIVEPGATVNGDIITGKGREKDGKTSDKSRPALERYLHWLQGKCDDLPLAAMGGHKGQGEEMTLTDVYQALDTERDLQMELFPSTNYAEPGNPFATRKGRGQRKLTAFEAAREYRHLVLLGGPGSGKSAFVNTLAIRLAAAALPGKENAPKTVDVNGKALARDFGLPVRLMVREMGAELAKLDLPLEADEKTLEPLAALVRQCWKAELGRADALDAWPRIEAALREGAATMIFDGLDEVPLAIRRRARQAISAAIGVYKKARCIVTCRTRSYGGASLDGFESVGLALFDEDRIKAFVGAFYRAPVNRHSLSNDQIRERIDELERAALGRLALLSSTPLLLMVMAIVHRSSISLPSERVKLFDLAIDVLVMRWQIHNHEMVISPTVKRFLENEKLRRKVLEKIAYDTHAAQSKERDPDFALSRYEILPWLETAEYLGGGAGEFLDYVDQTSGLLIGYGGGDGVTGPPATYGFPHRQFQEHLAGRHMVQGNTNQRRKAYLLRAGEDDFWSEPAQLGAETLKYADTDDSRLPELVRSLISEQAPRTTAEWRATLWAGRMALLAGKDIVVRDADDAGQPGFWDQRLMPRLVELLNNDQLPGIERADAGNLVAALGDPRFDPNFYDLPFDREHGLRGFIRIEAGSFLMGRDGIENAFPHAVDVPRFFISRWPVTWAQYRRFLKDSEHAATGIHFEPDAYGALDNHPVRDVNWFDAIAYCDWLETRFREDPHTPPEMLEVLHSGGSVSLPSEAEWEKAALGGSNTLYPWGEQADPNRANYDDSRVNGTSAVGCFPGVEDRYSYGCDDMLGNVLEWTRSWYRPYPYRADDREERRAQTGDTARVVRGGSYDRDGRDVRPAFRFGYPPDFRYDSFGFRVVVSPFRTSGRWTLWPLTL